MKYKYLNRFETVYCAECDGQECLTVNSYTEEVLCTACLTDLTELPDDRPNSDYEYDQMRQRQKDNKLTGDL